MRALIALADEPNGKVALKVTHVDGFDATSNAHRLSQQIVKWLDAQCVEKETIAPETVTPEEQAFARRIGAPILIPQSPC